MDRRRTKPVGRSLTCYGLPAALWLVVAGCCQLTGIPEQDQFEPLSSFSEKGQAVVRVYGAPIPMLERIAIHTWVATKRANEKTFHRWEIWWCPEDDHGVVCQDRAAAALGIGPTPTFVLGELVGDRADAVAEFIERASPVYPFQTTYYAIPGPNSNTYVQWLLDNAGWNLKLQPCAIGADWHPVSGWPPVILDGENP